MKRVLTLFLMVMFIAANFTSCEMLEDKPSEEEVIEAVGVAFGAWFIGALLADLYDGVTYNDTTGVVTFSSFDISEMDTDYSSISGTVAPNDAGTALDFNVSLKGGPVEKLKFSITESFLLNSGTNAVSLSVEANGFDYDITIEPTDE